MSPEPEPEPEPERKYAKPREFFLSATAEKNQNRNFKRLPRATHCTDRAQTSRKVTALLICVDTWGARAKSACTKRYDRKQKKSRLYVYIFRLLRMNSDNLAVIMSLLGAQSFPPRVWQVCSCHSYCHCHCHYPHGHGYGFCSCFCSHSCSHSCSCSCSYSY